MNKFHFYLIDINDYFPFFNASTNYSFNIDDNNEENLILHTIQTFNFNENDHITFYLEFKNKEQNISIL